MYAYWKLQCINALKTKQKAVIDLIAEKVHASRSQFHCCIKKAMELKAIANALYKRTNIYNRHQNCLKVNAIQLVHEKYMHMHKKLLLSFSIRKTLRIGEN